jgi:hypothetical protein
MARKTSKAVTAECRELMRKESALRCAIKRAVKLGYNLDAPPLSVMVDYHDACIARLRLEEFRLMEMG